MSRFVSVFCGNAEIPCICEVVAEREGSMPGKSIEELSVFAVSPQVFGTGERWTGLEGDVPTMAILIWGITAGERTGHGAHAQ